MTIWCDIEIIRYDQEGGVRAISNRLVASMSDLGHFPRVREVAPPARNRLKSVLVNIVPRQCTNALKRLFAFAECRRLNLPAAPATFWPCVRIYAHPDLVRMVPPCPGWINIVWFHDSWNAAIANGHALTIRRVQAWIDLLVLLTEGDAESARSDLEIPVVAVRNPGPALGEYLEDIDFDSGCYGIAHRSKRVVMLTRHDRQKDVALALRAWRISTLSRTGWTLEIYGDGPLRAWNATLSKILRLHGVRFHQRTSDPIAVLLDSRALLCSSRHEGFPSSFLESMTVGTPIISVDSFPGCAELLSSGCGLVVDDRSGGSLAEGLDAFGRLKEARLVEMSSACLRRAQGYEGRPVAEIWLKLLESTAQARFTCG